MKNLKLRFLTAVSLLIVISNMGNFSYSARVDDFRELAGGERLSQAYSRSEINRIQYEYFRIERHNRAVYLMNSISSDGDIRLQGKREELQEEIKSQQLRLVDSFRAGEPVYSLLKEKTRYDTLVHELSSLKFDNQDIIPMDFIDNPWEEEYNNIQVIADTISSEKDVGVVGNKAKFPVRGNFRIRSLFFEGDQHSDTDQKHTGIDFEFYGDGEVLSAWSGIVTKVGSIGEDLFYVLVRHDEGLETKYFPLTEVIVEENQTVNQYDPVGVVGEASQYLHYEVRLDNKSVDPLYFYGVRGKSVLQEYLSNRPDLINQDYWRSLFGNIQDVEFEDTNTGFSEEVREGELTINLEESYKPSPTPRVLDREVNKKEYLEMEEGG